MCRCLPLVVDGVARGPRQALVLLQVAVRPEHRGVRDPIPSCRAPQHTSEDWPSGRPREQERERAKAERTTKERAKDRAASERDRERQRHHAASTPAAITAVHRSSLMHKARCLTRKSAFKVRHAGKGGTARNGSRAVAQGSVCLADHLHVAHVWHLRLAPVPRPSSCAPTCNHRSRPRLASRSHAVGGASRSKVTRPRSHREGRERPADGEEEVGRTREGLKGSMEEPPSKMTEHWCGPEGAGTGWYANWRKD